MFSLRREAIFASAILFLLAARVASVFRGLDCCKDSGRHPYGSLTTLATGAYGRKEFKRLASFSGGR